VGATKVNDSLEMGFRRRMGAGGEGKKIFWRRNFSEGWVLRLGVGAAKVNNFLEIGFR